MNTARTLAKAAAVTALVAFSAGSFAAKPTSIVFNENAQNAEGTPYANYMVKCSNGKKAELTAWNKRRKWCVGDMNSQDCEKKQIKAAKAACKAA
ncbi:MAG: hypothetical protein AB8C02_12385 [Halioglobus sp.]